MKECKYRISLRKKDRGCIEHDCHHYVPIRMNNAQTKETIDQFMCDDLARLQVAFDTGKLTTEVGASIDSLRNISHTNLSQIGRILLTATKQVKIKEG